MQQFIQRIALCALVAAGLNACVSPNAEECDTGIICPNGTHCAAAQKVCIADENLCGNAVLDGCSRNQGLNEYLIRAGYSF